MEADHSSSDSPVQFLEPGAADVRPRCTICNKVFKRMYGLERHIVVHDPLRSRLEHKCPYEGCKFSSLQKSNVKTHIAAVHEKIKHACTLPSNIEADSNLVIDQSEQCGRIFSDIPALIRHEKRAHGFFRRDALAKAKARGDTAQNIQFQHVEAGDPTFHNSACSSAEDLQVQTTTQTAYPDDKVRFWLQANGRNVDERMEWESDNDTPSQVTFPALQTQTQRMNALPGPPISVPESTCILASASDAESVTTGSAFSSFSTPPSPATNHSNQMYLPVSTYPTAFSAGCYYPPLTNDYNTINQHHLPDAQYSQNANPAEFYYAGENPPIEEWLPPFSEMKQAMQASYTHDETSEWDGIVTGLSLVG